VPNGSAPDAPLRAPEVEIVLKLTYPRLATYLAFFALLLAQIMVAISGKVKDILVTLQLPANVLSQATTIEWLLAIVGPVVTAVTLLLLYRQFPAGSK
jgi:hypothetical protein